MTLDNGVPLNLVHGRSNAVHTRHPDAWHTHPKGQTLYVTDGNGYVARRGGEVHEIRPGDVVYIEPGEEHWHGATADRFMAHVAHCCARCPGTRPAAGRSVRVAVAP